MDPLFHIFNPDGSPVPELHEHSFSSHLRIFKNGDLTIYQDRVNESMVIEEGLSSVEFKGARDIKWALDVVRFIYNDK